MSTIITVIILLLSGITITLALLNWKIHVQLNNKKNVEKKIDGLNAIREFMETIGETINVEDKVKKINDIIMEKYDIKYSTIVEFNGTGYVVRASNVDEKHWENLSSLHDEEIFKDSITTQTTKYITVDKEREKLPYQKSEMGRSKSAMFFPLYIDNIYIGYWIIESGEPHAFDDIDTTVLDIIKESIVSVLKAVNYQKIVESLPRDDYYSALKTGEYLFNDGRKKIDKFSKSTICMFRITNIEEINDKYNRETGNQAIIDMCDYIRENLSEEYVFVRYMGPKFVIAFSGVEIDAVVKFIIDLKKSTEKLKIKKVEKEDKTDKIDKTDKTGKTDKEEYVKIKLNFALRTYYKGTALEKLLKFLEEYIDNAPENESAINQI